MITIISGKPGSGKTYYAVYHMLKKHFTWDNTLKEYFPKGKVTIFTNIEDLRLQHQNLATILNDVPLEKFFTVDYQKKLIEKFGSLVYIIDEAQRFFHSKFSNPDVEFFFQYHRHLAVDIYLITQDVSLLSRRFVHLTEFIIQASPRSLQPGRFSYQRMAAGELVSRFTIRKSPSIFRLYSSFDQSSENKAPNYITRYLSLFGGLAFITLLLFYLFVTHWMHFSSHSRKASVSSLSKSQVSSVKKSSSKPSKASQISKVSKSYSPAALASDVEQPSSFPSVQQVVQYVPFLLPQWRSQGFSENNTDKYYFDWSKLQKLQISPHSAFIYDYQLNPYSVQDIHLLAVRGYYKCDSQYCYVYRPFYYHVQTSLSSVSPPSTRQVSASQAQSQSQTQTESPQPGLHRPIVSSTVYQHDSASGRSWVSPTVASPYYQP